MALVLVLTLNLVTPLVMLNPRIALVPFTALVLMLEERPPSMPKENAEVL
jgi:hypothetical protein